MQTKRPRRQISQEEYDEPVFYCKSCHSLAIINEESLADEDWDGSYCAVCNSTDIGVCKIGDWLAEEERRAKKRKELEWRK